MKRAAALGLLVVSAAWGQPIPPDKGSGPEWDSGTPMQSAFGRCRNCHDQNGTLEPLPSSLSVQHETNGTNSPYLLTWSDGAMVLEQATNLIGPWLSLPGSAVSPWVVWPTDSVRFFRLRRE